MSTGFVTAVQFSDITDSDVIESVNGALDTLNDALSSCVAVGDEIEYGEMARCVEIVVHAVSGIVGMSGFTSVLDHKGIHGYADTAGRADWEGFAKDGSGLSLFYVPGRADGPIEIVTEIDSPYSAFERGGWSRGQKVTAQHVLDGVAGLLSDAAGTLHRAFDSSPAASSLAEDMVGGPDTVREEANYVEGITDAEFDSIQRMSDEDLRCAIREVSQSEEGIRFEDSVVAVLSSEIDDLRSAAVRIALGKTT